MIQLRTLGSLDLRSPEEGELRQVLAQPKRFALLVYLAVAGRGAFHRRDTLFTLFWPESDEERARSSLRTALHFLRRALGADVIATRGTEEVGVAPGAVWCDALAFDAELTAGRPDAALELYQGTFLPGFNLAGTVEWDRWMSNERERLRRRAVEAAESLAARAEEDDDAAAVARWARRVSSLEPDDEGVLRRLMTRLAATGDCAGAVYAFEEFARRLRADCEAEPSRQTRALADEIRHDAAEPTLPRIAPKPASDEVAARAGSSASSHAIAGTHASGGAHRVDGVRTISGTHAIDAMAAVTGAHAIDGTHIGDEARAPEAHSTHAASTTASSLAALPVAENSAAPEPHVISHAPAIPPPSASESPAVATFAPVAADEAPTDLHASRASATEASEATAATTEPAVARAEPALTPPATTSRLRRRWTWIGATAAAALTVAGVWGTRAPAPGDTSAMRVAVLPFAVYGRGELGYLREGMVDLLSSKLDGAGDLRSVDARALLSSMDAAATGSPEAAGEAAERLGAGLFVMGSVVDAGPQVQLRAALYRRTGNGLVAESDVAVEGARDSLPRLVDRLTARLLAGRLSGPGARLQRTAVLTTPSMPALKAYLQGESALRDGHYDAAKAALQRAVDEDSTFALAWYRLSVATAGSGQRLGDAARHAVRYAGRLDSYDRLLLEAWLASWDFRYADAERMYRQAVATHPDDVEAWGQLAQVLFHGGPSRGHPSTESRPAWERVLALEPGNLDALGYLARIALTEGRTADADTLLARALALNPEGDRALVWSGYRGIALGDEAAMRRAVAGMRGTSDLGAWIIAWRMLEDTGDPVRARPMVEALLDPVRPARIRASGRVLLAHAELARGRWSAARAQLDSAAELDADVALQARTLFSVLPFLPVDAGEVGRVRAALLARTAGIPDAPPGPEPQGPYAGAAFPELRLHALGLLEARAGNLRGAMEYARRLEAMNPPSAGLRIRGPLLADGVRAHVAWLGGHPSDGLAVMDSAWQELNRKPEVFPYLVDSGHPRFLRAELLRMAGRDREALAWYGSVTEHFDKSIVYAAPVHLRTAEILDRMGRRAEAVSHYRRFVALWRDCDPALRPRLDRARRRLQQLEP